MAQQVAEVGATLVLWHQSERLQREAEQLLAPRPDRRRARLPVRRLRDEEIDAVFEQIAAASDPKIDILIHLRRVRQPTPQERFPADRGAQDFRIAHDVSVYS